MANNKRTNLIAWDADSNEIESNDNSSQYDSDYDSGSYSGSSSFSGGDADSKEITFMDIFDSVRFGHGAVDKSDFVDVFTNESGNESTLAEVFTDESGSDSDDYSTFVHELRGLQSKSANVESFLNGCLVFTSSGVVPAAGHPDPESNDTNNIEFRGVPLGTAENDLDGIPGESKRRTKRGASYFLRRRRCVVWRRFLLFVAAITISLVIVLTMRQPQLSNSDGKISVEDDQDQLLSPTAAPLPTNGTAGGSPLSEDYIDLEDVSLTNVATASSLSGPQFYDPNEGKLFEEHDLYLGGTNESPTEPSATESFEESELTLEARTTHTHKHNHFHHDRFHGW